MNFQKIVMVFQKMAGRLGGLAALGLLALAMPPLAQAGPYSALVVDVDTDRVLYAQNPDELRHPASLTKMMTLYLVFEALSKGELSLDTPMVASAFAVSKPPSRLGLKAGETITVEEGILGLVAQSANDAATVIAETLGDTEPAFAEMMTQKARQLGMGSTVFRNAQGLPNPAQVTTAWDMYRLAKALIKQFPQYYAYFSTESFWFRDHSFRNHNHLLGKYSGADGIKTGFINASGFNLVASARRDGVRLVGVVFGGISHSVRDAHMMELLDDGFAQMEGHEPAFHLASYGGQFPGLLRKSAALSKSQAVKPQDSDDQDDPVDVKLREPKKEQKREVKQADGPSRKDEERNTSWELRVGVFDQQKAAQQRLAQANQMAPFALRHAKGSVVSHTHRGKKMYIAYFNGLSKEDVALACQNLKRKKLECSPSSSG